MAYHAHLVERVSCFWVTIQVILGSRLQHLVIRMLLLRLLKKPSRTMPVYARWMAAMIAT